MDNIVHTFKIDIDWKLIKLISQVDRFDAAWSSMERKEGKSLKQLKSIATVRSVGASTRIEGSVMSDEEVEVLLENMDITKLEDRDAQEVAGYFEVLELVSATYKNIDLTESSVKSLHNILMKHSKKDAWHKGEYKQHSNAVEASYPDGTKRIIFQTTPPGLPTQEAVKALVKWYKDDQDTHPLVKSALFAYEFLSIHPFQDGNGRLSRLISTLLLLKNGYKWIEYISFEHEIENRKTEYYKALMNCQVQRPGENVTEWLLFFLGSLKNIQEQLSKKLEKTGIKTRLAPKERSVLGYIDNHPGCRSGEMAEKLGIPLPTTKRIIKRLLDQNLIEKYGVGPGTNYTLS